MENWLHQHLAKVIAGVLLTIAGAMMDRFSDEINAWVRSQFIDGIGGTYILKTWTYAESDPLKLVPWTQTVKLKDGGRTVFGVSEATESGSKYKLFGFQRTKFLAISYGGESHLGGGTLALQSEIAKKTSPIFWGWRTAVECIGKDAFFVQCPVLMVKQGTEIPEKAYEKFFRAELCSTVRHDRPPESCAYLKTLTN